MPYICKDCSNKTEFRRVVWGSCSYTETEYLNEHGDCEDSENMEHDNYESEDSDPMECSECGSTDVEDVENDEWEAWQGPDAEVEDDPNVKGEDESWKDFIERKKKPL